MDFDATLIPVDVVAALNLEYGLDYLLQNVAPSATLFVRESLTAPAVTERGFKVESGGRFVLRPKPIDVPLWLWTDEPAGCAVIVGNSVAQ